MCRRDVLCAGPGTNGRKEGRTEQGLDDWFDYRLRPKRNRGNKTVHNFGVPLSDLTIDYGLNGTEIRTPLPEQEELRAAAAAAGAHGSAAGAQGAATGAQGAAAGAGGGRGWRARPCACRVRAQGLPVAAAAGCGSRRTRAGPAAVPQGGACAACRARCAGPWMGAHTAAAHTQSLHTLNPCTRSILAHTQSLDTHNPCTYSIAHAHTHGLCVGGLLVACGVGSAPAPPSAVWRPLATACCAGPWTGSRILADVLELGGRARNRCRRRAPFDSSFDFRGKFTGRRCCAGRCPYESVAPMCPMPLSCCYVAAMLDAWVCKAFHRAAPCTSPSWTLIPNKALSLSLSLSLA